MDIVRATTPRARQQKSTRLSYTRAIGGILPDAEAKKLWKAVQALASEYLDTESTLRDQVPGNWDEFLQTATIEFPIFARFPNSYPLRDYVTRWMANQRHSALSRTKSGAAGKKGKKVKKGLARKDKENGNAGPQTASSAVVLYNASERLMSSDDLKEESDGEKEHIAKSFRKPREPLESAKSPQMYVEVPPKISPTCLQPPTLFRAQIPESSASRPRASSQASSSTLLSSPDAAPSDPSASDSVLAFLSSLSPPQPHLWPVFNRLGISNAECLRALAARPESRVDAFFQKLVQKGEFSVFQVDAIQWGLKDMADRAEYA